MRDHNPIVIEEFNGLWQRGDKDSTPPDHFSDCNNIRFVQSGFATRYGITPYIPIPNIKRIYTFVQETGESILCLNASGQIFDSAFPATPILTVIGMTDFGFVSINGRAYLTPCDGHTGLENEFVYVYEGDGTAARRAGGAAPIDAEGALAAANSGSAGNVEEGIHIFGVVYETISGFLTSIGPDTLPFVTAPGGESVDLTNIPVSPSAFVTRVHVVATRAINPSFYTGDTRGYDFYFVPDGDVANGTTTLTVSFFDGDLLEQATQLQDLFTNIPAGVGLNVYHQRMLIYATFDDISLCYVSNVDEPEAVNQIDGLIVVPLDGKPLTNGQEFRDILYLFKQTRTDAYSDNGDVPSSWPLTILDQGIGASIHGIAAVLDSGGVNIDYLEIVDYSGVMLFDGSYKRPELSWKISDFWLALDRDFFDLIQIINDSLSQFLFITLPNKQMLFGDYSNGLDPKNIKWTRWTFDVETTTITLVETNKLLIGSDTLVVP